MRKSKYLFISLISFFSFGLFVNAAGTAALSVNSSSIENGGSVTATVTLRNSAAWNVTISSSGSTSGCTQKFVGDSGTGQNVTKTFSVTCRSTSTGIISFAMSGDITSSDGVNTKISGTRGVTVVAPRPKSTNNFLSALTVSGGVLSPAFDKNTLDYIVELNPETKTADITATKEDSRASIVGVGTVNLVDGENPFQVTVTAENGSVKTYKINVKVKEYDPIEVMLDSKKLTVVRKKELVVCPISFTDSVVKYADNDLPGCVNEKSKLTLLLLRNEAGTPSFYVLNDNKFSEYRGIAFGTKVFLPLEFESDFKVSERFEKKGIKIGDYSVTVYQYKNNTDFNIVYGVNVEDGSKGLYLYDSKEKTLQRYSFDNLFDQIDKEKEKLLLFVLPLAATSSILLITTILLLVNNGKMKKKTRLMNKITGDVVDNKKSKKNRDKEEELEKTMKIGE